MVTSIIAIGIFNIPTFARITRGSANAVWAREFVLAARASRQGRASRITIEHVLPNILSVLIVQATIQFALAILAEAALSYLGLGTQPPQPSWGRMLNEAQTLLFQAPMLAVYPGRRDRARGARPQPARRRLARPARSAPGAGALTMTIRNMPCSKSTTSASQLQHQPRPGAGRARRQLRAGARRDAGPGRRIRLRQVDHGAGADGPAAGQRRRHAAASGFDGSELVGLSRCATTASCAATASA